MKYLFGLLMATLLTGGTITAHDAKAVADSIATRCMADTTLLHEVIVTAPLTTREADRTVLYVAGNPLSANMDAQELLKTAPGVWATDESLSIYGQEGTAVYINDNKVDMTGRRLMTYLKSIQSSSIATIEVIPKGGAEYSADSSGGVIRINLKRNRVEGISGSTGLNATGSEYKAWINPYANVSLHSVKWTFNVSGNLNGSPMEKRATNEQSTNASSGISLEGASKHKDKSFQGGAMLGIFYQATVNDRLGLQLDCNYDNSDQLSQSTTVMSGTRHGETSGEYDNDHRFRNFNAAFNWHHKIGRDGSELKWISGYNRQQTSGNESNRMSWSYIKDDSIYNTRNIDRYNIIASELSLTKILPKEWRINCGIKYTRNDMKYRSSHCYFRGNALIEDNKYDYDNSFAENILAAYVAANGQTGRWKYKAGVRGELYKSSAGTSNDRQFDLYPNANVSYSLTEDGDYAASIGYYRNVRRPSFWALSPIVRQVSDYSYTVGNPELHPSFSNSLSLDFILAKRFTVAAGYTHTSDAIRQMFKSDPWHPERMYLTWGNTGTIHNGFIHGDGFIQPLRWLTLYASATYVIENQKLDKGVKSETISYIQIVGSTTFQLPGGFSVTANCFYNSPMTIGNIKIYPILNIDPCVRKSFGSRWSISLGTENILQRTGKTRTKSSGYDRLTSTKNHAAVKLNVTYKFNSGKRFRSPDIERNMDRTRLEKE